MGWQYELKHGPGRASIPHYLVYAYNDDRVAIEAFKDRDVPVWHVNVDVYVNDVATQHYENVGPTLDIAFSRIEEEIKLNITSIKHLTGGKK